MGIRLRAEHAILSYLLTGKNEIPHASPQLCEELRIPCYDPQHWYPNYPQVCDFLINSIKNLSFSHLTELYLSMEIDGVIKLAPNFKELILTSLMQKLPEDQYETFIIQHLNQMQRQLLQDLFIPETLIDQSSNTLSISKGWMKQLTSQHPKVIMDPQESKEEQLIKYLKL